MTIIELLNLIKSTLEWLLKIMAATSIGLRLTELILVCQENRESQNLTKPLHVSVMPGSV